MAHAEVIEDAGKENDAYCYRKSTTNILSCCTAFRKIVVLRDRAGGDSSGCDEQLESE